MNLINEVSEDLEEKIEEIAETLFKLEKYWLKSRYPLKKGDKIWDPTAAYSKREVLKAIESAEEVISIIGGIINDLERE